MVKTNNVSLGRRLGSILLAMALLFPFIPVSVAHAASFTDIDNHWAETYIEQAAAQGIINGYPNGKFGPNQQVTRAEFVSMLNRALGNTGLVANSFKDVRSTDWFYTDVRKAVNSSYVSGYDDGTFRPQNIISRQEAAVMIARIVPTYGYSGRLQDFTDYRNVASWATAAMSRVYDKGYVGGYTDGKIHPLDPLTRAQAAKIIVDIIDQETIVSSDPLVKKDGTKLSGKIYSNNVTIHSDLDEDSATIENCVILGTLHIQGGGIDTVTVNNSRIAKARIDRADEPVRLLLKGESSILNTSAEETGILQTSGIASGSFSTGFEHISLSASSEFILRGSFPSVSVDGSSAALVLESGSIASLTVASGGRRSNVTVDSGASISTANVYAESYFHGVGTITTMKVYADDITYETKPRTITVGSGGSTPVKVDPDLSITFAPLDAATDVYLDTKVTLTFSRAILKANGNSIANADIPNLVKLRKGSSTGTIVDFTGTINTAKTIMTITPTENLSANTKYYVVMAKEVVMDANEMYNEAASNLFTTGTKTQKLTVTYNPVNNATGIQQDVNSLTITFSDALTRYDKTAITDSYLKSSVISFDKGGTAMSSSAYTVSINSAKTVITIRPNDYLDLNTKYYFGIKSATLKTAFGTTVPASEVNFTTSTLAQTAPVATNVSVTGIAKVGGTLTGTYTYSDANNDLEGTSTFRWYISDTAGGTYAPITGATSKTYTMKSSDLGKYIKFQVTPIAKTGVLTGAPVLSAATSAVIEIPEAAPVASSVTISGTAKVGATLTGNYAYTDVNDDAEGSSIFRWYISDTAEGPYTLITGATSRSYTITSEDLNKYIKFEVTPVAQTGTSPGTPVLSGSTLQVKVAEAAPVASAVAISGNAKVGETLTGTYTYSDANGDSEGSSTFRWLANTGSAGGYEAISGAVGTTYRVDVSLIGKSIMFEVTPKATSGTINGSPATSAPTSAVIAATPTV